MYGSALKALLKQIVDGTPCKAHDEQCVEVGLLYCVIRLVLDRLESLCRFHIDAGICVSMGIFVYLLVRVQAFCVSRKYHIKFVCACVCVSE